MRKIVMTLFFIFLCSAVSFGQAKLFKVGVRVIHNDKNIQNSIESYLTRELRSLGDVEVTNDGPFYMIHVTAMTAKFGGKDIGYTFGYAITWESTCGEGKNVEKCQVFESVGVVNMPTEQLQNQCQRLVTDFDVNQLKRLRKK